jgi:hypothetical protein
MRLRPLFDESAAEHVAAERFVDGSSWSGIGTLAQMEFVDGARARVYARCPRQFETTKVQHF